VRPGDEVAIGPRREAVDVPILFDRDGLVACVKPAGIPTVPDEGGAAHALVRIVATKIAAEDLRVTSRLDREVSGVVLFARDATAEERLKLARARGEYRRRYVALARYRSTSINVDRVDRVDRVDPRGRPDPRDRREPPEGAAGAWGTWAAPIGRGRDARHRAVNGPDAKASTTRWRIVERSGQADVALLAVDPVTGRTHQIRVHASDAGMPLLGDRDYGGPTRLTLDDGRTIATARIALHCARVALPEVEAEAPVPDALRDLWSALGGAAEAWDTAVSCDFAS
jgi:23S rRNA-/tRNA-specific pseudouridylate synthase